MRMARKTPFVAVTLSLALFAAACGDDNKSSDTTVAAATETTAAAAPETTAAVTETTAAAVDTTVAGTETTAAAGTETTVAGAAASATSDLKAAGCPDPLVIQTDWYPEVDHSEVYALAAPGGTVDKAKGTYTAALIDPRNGAQTGVQIQIRNGGPATQFTQPYVLMHTDPAIFAGYVTTDDGIFQAKDNPTIAVVAARERNPQIIMWDPATYPDVKTIADLKATKAKVRYFSNAAYMEYLVGNGILDAAQVDSSYDGKPANFIADGGKAAQQGFSTAEPYAYKNLITEWGKDVAYQLVSETGYDAYAEAIAVTPETLAAKKDCLKAFVPMVQAAQVNFIKTPGATEDLIVKVVADQNSGWQYDKGQAEAATKQSVADGIISNGPDATLGNMDEAKVQKMIDILTPLAVKRNAALKDGLKPTDVFTNEFIDPSIGLP